MNEWLEDYMLLTPTDLLSSENCPPHLTNLLLTPTPPNHLHLHFPAKLSHLAGDVDSGQGLEAEGMQTFLKTMNWAEPFLVFPSLVASLGELFGLGKEWATSGTP